jgi:hypothetical protein
VAHPEAKARGGVGGGGALVRSGKPSASVVFVPPVRDFEMIDWAVRPKNGMVAFCFSLAGGFYARLALAWEILMGRSIPALAHPRVALDLSRRLVQAAAHAEVGDEEESEEEDDHAA